MNVAFVLLLSHCALVLGWSDWHPDNCKDGRRAIVQLFEWKWTDIAEECEGFLEPIGYCGVQVSPVTEHVTTAENAWWERYQPVSYKISSRSGSEEQFTDMVQRCNDVGVRIYVDVVLNHMTTVTYNSDTHPGYAGSEYDADQLFFREVPYYAASFHSCGSCGESCTVTDWTDHRMVRECRKDNLIDLKQSARETGPVMADFLNDLIAIGVAGFRIDSAIHMYPADLEEIWIQLNSLKTPEFPPASKPFIMLSVQDLNQPEHIQASEYIQIGKVSEFRHGLKIVDAARNPPSIGSIYDPTIGMLNASDAVAFVDSHETQRGVGGIGDVLSYKNGTDYIMAQALTLSFTYGFPRVMSSYDFGADTERGPPMVDGAISDVEIQPDGSCGGEWVCEHRWTAIAGLVTWAKATSGTDILTWWEEGDKLAFSRGGRGFVAFNNPDQVINTGLPAGEYCNVAQGCPTEDGCTGDIITVEAGGNGFIYGSDIVAIHVDAMAGSNECIFGIPAPTGQPQTTIRTEPTTFQTEPTTIPTEPTTIPTEPTTIPTEPTTIPTEPTTIPTEPTTTESPWKKTIIYIDTNVADGQFVFYRGGVSHQMNPACEGDTDASSECSIPISVNSIGETSHYDPYNAWSVGDTVLDWHGAEVGQGSYQDITALGTPAAWTTNDVNHPGYQPDNSWGPNLLKVEFMMNCDETLDGWFEFKAFKYIPGQGDQWENDIKQDLTCFGDLDAQTPFQNICHIALCGARNKFGWNFPYCDISSISDDS